MTAALLRIGAIGQGTPVRDLAKLLTRLLKPGCRRLPECMTKWPVMRPSGKHEKEVAAVD